MSNTDNQLNLCIGNGKLKAQIKYLLIIHSILIIMLCDMITLRYKYDMELKKMNKSKLNRNTIIL